jgi:spermidine synthase
MMSGGSPTLPLLLRMNTKPQTSREPLPCPGDVELDRRQTSLGEIILRRGVIQSLDDATVYEILIDGEMLMSSVVNFSEIALARIGLEAWGPVPSRVLVGGLGLGYTAHAALRTARVRSVDVLELLEPVLEWHETGQVPLGMELSSDPRVRLLHGDFFAWVRGDDPVCARTLPRYDVILLDIDHSSEYLLQATHAPFYSEEGLRALSDRLEDGGVFAYWSSDVSERHLADTLRQVFPVVEEHAVEFYNPGRVEYDTNTIVIGRKKR